MLWPTSDLVAVSWLLSIDWPDPVPGVATTLPEKTDWNTDLFIQVTTIGGGIDNYLPIRTPVIQVDAFAKASTSSTKPQWGLANHACEVIIAASFGAQSYSGDLQLPGTFSSVRVTGVSVVTEPRRRMNDIQALARYQMDIEIPYLVKEMEYE